MNEDILKGKWKQLKGSLRKTWGKLTDDDVEQINGNYESLVGKLQERYGILTDEAEQQVDKWIAKAGPQDSAQAGRANHQASRSGR